MISGHNVLIHWPLDEHLPIPSFLASSSVFKSVSSLWTCKIRVCIKTILWLKSQLLGNRPIKSLFYSRETAKAVLQYLCSCYLISCCHINSSYLCIFRATRSLLNGIDYYPQSSSSLGKIGFRLTNSIFGFKSSGIKGSPFGTSTVEASLNNCWSIDPLTNER